MQLNHRYNTQNWIGIKLITCAIKLYTFYSVQCVFAFMACIVNKFAASSEALEAHGKEDILIGGTLMIYFIAM